VEELALHKMPRTVQNSTTNEQPPNNSEMCFDLQWTSGKDTRLSQE